MEIEGRQVSSCRIPGGTKILDWATQPDTPHDVLDAMQILKYYLDTAGTHRALLHIKDDLLARQPPIGV